MRLLGEEALARLPAVVEGQVETPCGVAEGLVTVAGPPVCVVSIVRSGDILQEAVRYLQPGVSVGKILIQRDESKPDKPAILYYKKLPKNISESFVILVDPMLATGGSAIRALEVLKVSRQTNIRSGVRSNLSYSGQRSEDREHPLPQPCLLSGGFESHGRELP